MEWFPDICAFVGGLLVALGDFFMMRKAADMPEKINTFITLRTVISAVAIALLYFIGKAADLKLVPFMVSGAVGLTLGILVTTLVMMHKQKD